MNRILLLEDHKRLALLISKGLASAGIVVDSFERIDHAWQALQQLPYQAMVLDRGVPDGDGLSLLQRLRTAGNNVPCLVLTARNALHDRVNGLEAGADDYLAKPFAMEEMVARVKALLRRPVEFQSLDPVCGDLLLQTASNLICCADKSQLLAQAEMQVLVVLMRKQGETVRHNLLEAAAWGFTEAVTPNALDVVLHRIRKKLQAIGSRQQIINVRGVGYALVEPKIR
ncbi:MAG: response regulator transcription factor [Gammaproteobacteria bacterium]|nr:response regulator transcription factor [Gammaproteobacteria bacterium]MBU2057128.1 response regulator transcription factor [Gammaproteobacteria bacterium]MBU2175020.1 response regulator transcription factor [Gammaproteobacteria bacterium]MBU2246216.1 response regulator transcription factor [Gammaproteobacteria bacterium]MBU2344606.1 response regulator transcription factor [Gammaproteobacteria bacterium]